MKHHRLLFRVAHTKRVGSDGCAGGSRLSFIRHLPIDRNVVAFGDVITLLSEEVFRGEILLSDAFGAFFRREFPGRFLGCAIQSLTHDLIREFMASRDSRQTPEIQIVADPGVERGGCWLETEQGEVDATIGGRISRLDNALDELG